MPSAKKRRELMAESERKSSRDSAQAAYDSNTDYLQEAFDARMSKGDDGGEAIRKNRLRAKLLSAQYEFFDARDLLTNSHNDYIVDNDSVEALADLIYESGNVTPIIVRGIDDGFEIIDGERRTRACILNGERYDEKFYMLPARYFPPGTLSDEDAKFMLDAENVGQRAMTPSERARGVARVAERILARRAENPEQYAGEKTKEILARQFGVSPRTAAMEVNIGSNLSETGMAMYDEGEITKTDADAIARLDIEDQHDILDRVRSGNLGKEDIKDAVKAKTQPSTFTRSRKTTDDHLKSARRSLNKALAVGEKADRTLVAELRTQLEILDPEGNDDPDTLLLSAIVKLKKATQLDGIYSDEIIDQIKTLANNL